MTLYAREMELLLMGRGLPTLPGLTNMSDMGALRDEFHHQIIKLKVHICFLACMPPLRSALPRPVRSNLLSFLFTSCARRRCTRASTWASPSRARCPKTLACARSGEGRATCCLPGQE